MSSGPDLSGVYPVVQTPFTSSYDIDRDVLAHEVEWAFEHGADGLTIGMVSEVLRLSAHERKHLAQDLCTMADGRSVIVSCGAESTRAAIDLATHGESVGAAALMAIPPLHVGVTDDELVGYFSAILRTTTIPLVVQDASGYVGRPMSSHVLRELADLFGPRVLAKPEAAPIGPNLSAIREATGGRVPVFEGTGGMALVDSFRRGINGTMPAVDLCWAVRRIWDLLSVGDYDSAYVVSAPLCALIALQTELDAFVALEKYLLVRQGVFVNTVQRGPVSYVPDRETLAEVDRLFDRLESAVAQSPSPVGRQGA